MTPVESRTHLISTSGTALLNASAYAFSWSVSSAVYTSSSVFCADAAPLANTANAAADSTDDSQRMPRWDFIDVLLIANGLEIRVMRQMHFP